MSTDETIRLSPSEVRVAAIIGSERRLQSFDLPDKHGFSGEDGWTVDIEAAAGEMAFAKYLGRYWGCDVGTFKQADIGKSIQVRTVKEHGLSLIVREADPDDHVYVLMVGRAPNFQFGGWLRGKHAKQDAYWRAPNGRPGAWFVPEHALRKETRSA